MELSPLKSRRGQAMGATIVALTIAGVFLILGLVMLQAFRDTSAVDSSVSGSIVNETLTTVDELGELVVERNTPGFNSFAVTIAINASTGNVIPTTNYTTQADGRINFTGEGDSEAFNNTDWNVSYTYLHGGNVYRGSNLTVTGLASMSDFWEIIVLAVVISIIIGLLLLTFGGTQRR